MGGFAKGLENVDTITKTILVAIAGGTASVLGGGKFANGAMSAAFVFMFNEMGKRVVLDARSKERLRKIQTILKNAHVTRYVIVAGKYVADLVNNPIGDILEMRTIAKGQESTWEVAAEAVNAIPNITQATIDRLSIEMVTYYEYEGNNNLSQFWRGIYNGH